MWTTKRLVVRRYSDSDLPALESLCRDDKVWVHSTRDWSAVPDPGRAYWNELQLKNSSQHYGVYAALWDGSYVGEVGVYGESFANRRVNVGYNLLSQYWKKGLATELLAGLVTFLRRSDWVERIEATVLSDNGASVRVLEKNGFLHEGTLRKYVYVNGKPCDVGYYSLIVERDKPGITQNEGES